MGPKIRFVSELPKFAWLPGGHVVAFATTSCVLASMSKNALGLCFMGCLEEQVEGGQNLCILI